MGYPAYFNSNIERKIISKIISAALAKNWSISVHDGEEYNLRDSRDSDNIKSHVATTEETYLYFCDMDKNYLGFIWFVHGNEQEVLTDYTTGDEMDEVASAGGYM